MTNHTLLPIDDFPGSRWVLPERTVARNEN